ncbi:hypothetical protein BN7_1200 [Wickerhamomyces ciferrii]|uniref:Uncharacterized protein n=1 Tax=Wickerhamomyces ciferrii (strain ATCC 14091 / BCRC 22168 / CBS 111 / JCM 3599 / NBRC 0793 / NRRL Y-1031 F-60-10) TaxID=1206466 RepID=K0KJJ4_WICCF|nr:uncharacterized protein BN7_1200 [Wickerhamomyces ciferrii]CCH41659.1 hypothetical protein BN7_1200 [Wickerhamomyces ciferrii]
MSQLESLLSWAKEQGVQVQKGVTFQKTNSAGLTICYEGDEPLDNKEPVLQIPEHITITPILADRVFGSEVVPKGNRTPLTQLLVAKLRFDQSDDTKTLDDDTNVSKLLKPFIEFLPTGREIGSPFFWNEMERSLIKNTDADLAIDVGLNKLVEEWYDIVTKLPKKFQSYQYQKDLKFFHDFQKDRDVSKHFEFFNDDSVSWTSFAAYLWSSTIFTSRGFPFLISSTDECRDLNEGMLVPIQDLSNHNPSVEIKWGRLDKFMTFTTEQIVKKGDEIFSNYGPKSNHELLFGYGFVMDNNIYDKAVLALRLQDVNITEAQKFGIKLIGDEVSYPITNENPLPQGLIDLFAFLVKNDQEDSVTLRNRLEGLDQLQSILEQKIEFLKNLKNDVGKDGFKINPYFLKVAKTYKTTQRLLFQKSLEEISKLIKNLLKQYKPLSFKSVLKQDKPFSKSLEQLFGTQNYELLDKSDNLDKSVLLWITRVSNKSHYPKPEQTVLPTWIESKFQDLQGTNFSNDESILEVQEFYQDIFPKLGKTIPEIYGTGQWDFEKFKIGNKLIDLISFTRSISNEIFFINDIKL